VNTPSRSRTTAGRRSAKRCVTVKRERAVHQHYHSKRDKSELTGLDRVAGRSAVEPRTGPELAATIIRLSRPFVHMAGTLREVAETNAIRGPTMR
jgi:hypothetical protein